MLFQFQREEARGPKRKSEIRNSKSERNPKSEIRNPKCHRLGGFGGEAPNSNSARPRRFDRAELEFGAPIAGGCPSAATVRQEFQRKGAKTQRRKGKTGTEVPGCWSTNGHWNLMNRGSCTSVSPVRFQTHGRDARATTAAPVRGFKARNSFRRNLSPTAPLASLRLCAFALRVLRLLICHGSHARRAGQQAFRISDFEFRISFGFRISDFGFLSDLGLRTSDFGLSPASPPSVHS